jgi:hypothetical protein
MQRLPLLLRGVNMGKNNPPKKSTKAAIGGLSCSLSLVFMVISPLFPFSTFSFPAISGLLLLPVAVEIGFVTAVLSYFAVSFLSLFLAARLETVILFAAFFGYYPIVWYSISNYSSKFIRVVLKLLVFNSFCFLLYELIKNFADYFSFGYNDTWGFFFLLPLHFVFLLYDYAVGQFFSFFQHYAKNYTFKK